MSFVIAFCFSFKAQQVFTFKDRLGKQTLNPLAMMIIFVFNLGAAVALGSMLEGNYRALLPLVPAVINYGLFYVTSGLPLFRQ